MNHEHPDLDADMDAALNNYEPEPLPDDFVGEVMSSIKVSITQAPVQANFRLEFLDWALPFFAAVFAGIILFFIRGWETSDAISGVGLEQVSELLNSFDPGLAFLISLAVLAEIFFAVAVGIWLWSDNREDSISAR